MWVTVEQMCRDRKQMVAGRGCGVVVVVVEGTEGWLQTGSPSRVIKMF